jgi:hypothetical protein
MSREDFGRKILNETDIAIEKSQKRINGGRQHVYTGVELTSRAQQLLDDDDQAAKMQGLPTDDGGPRGREEQVYQTIQQHAGDSGKIAEGRLFALCSQSGMEIGKIEHAIQSLKDRGDIVEDPSREYYTT